MSPPWSMATRFRRKLHLRIVAAWENPPAPLQEDDDPPLRCCYAGPKPACRLSTLSHARAGRTTNYYTHPFSLHIHARALASSPQQRSVLLNRSGGEPDLASGEHGSKSRDEEKRKSAALCGKLGYAGYATVAYLPLTSTRTCCDCHRPEPTMDKSLTCEPA